MLATERSCGSEMERLPLECLVGQTTTATCNKDMADCKARNGTTKKAPEKSYTSLQIATKAQSVLGYVRKKYQIALHYKSDHTTNSTKINHTNSKVRLKIHFTLMRLDLQECVSEHYTPTRDCFTSFLPRAHIIFNAHKQTPMQFNITST